MTAKSAQEFLSRYLTDDEFRGQVDSAEEGRGFAHEAGYDSLASHIYPGLTQSLL